MSGDTQQLLKAEHESLRATLKRAMREEGPIGAAAAKVAALADAHFLREEKFVLPLLALLPGLARGDAQTPPGQAARMVQALRDEIGQMTAEHRQISEALRELARVAAAEDKGDYVAFAEDLILHAHREEAVLYPAAIVAGEHLLRLRAPG
jgi:hypothetical protein